MHNWDNYKLLIVNCKLLIVNCKLLIVTCKLSVDKDFTCDSVGEKHSFVGKNITVIIF